MKVSLVAHFEWVEDAGCGTWWADSPDVAGFYAAAPALGELQREAVDAVRWALETDEVDIDWTTEQDVPEWASTHVAFNPEGLVRPITTSSGPHSCQTVALFAGRIRTQVRIQPHARNYSIGV